MDTAQLKRAINTKMPFGKYAGRPLLLLPEPYLVWFKQQGFPDSQLGEAQWPRKNANAIIR